MYNWSAVEADYTHYKRTLITLLRKCWVKFGKPKLVIQVQSKGLAYTSTPMTLASGIAQNSPIPSCEQQYFPSSSSQQPTDRFSSTPTTTLAQSALGIAQNSPIPSCEQQYFPFSSSQQPTDRFSSTPTTTLAQSEAEYRALTHAACEL
ncbi:hypothetical protein Q3G72_033154 [Acer saccharum]|nr:hypothetical protein Q3G72_033154 [Acer saccharum]